MSSKESEKEKISITTKLIGFGFSAIVLYAVIAIIFSFWPFSSITGVVKQVTSAESIIGNYEWFYNQYYAIQAQQANIASMKKDAPEISGMTMVLNRAIGEYNSKSRQITRNLWKANDLPYQITIGGEK